MIINYESINTGNSYKEKSTNTVEASSSITSVSPTTKDSEQTVNNSMINKILVEKCTCENLNVTESMGPSNADISLSNLSLCSNIDKDTYDNHTCTSISDADTSDQTHAELEGSYSNSSIFLSGDQSSEYSSQVSDNTLISMLDLSGISGSDQVNFNYLLDLGLKCKGFEIGHLNIQGISNKIDQVRLLLESDKNQIHVLGLSETKLNSVHPDSVFGVTGFQPFRKDRETDSGVVYLYMLKMEFAATEEKTLNMKI